MKYNDEKYHYRKRFITADPASRRVIQSQNDYGKGIGCFDSNYRADCLYRYSVYSSICLTDGEIEATSNGFSLLKKKIPQLTNQLWESFLPLSIGAMLIKQLFFAKGISTQSFLHDSGISF